MKKHGRVKPVALVTGAAGTLGHAISVRLVRAGYDLVLHVRRTDARAWALAHELEADGARAALVAHDLVRVEGAAALIKRVASVFGRLDLLVNNASDFHSTPRGGKASQWDRLFRVNAAAPYFLAQASVPFLKRASGSVVNLLDTYAEHPTLPDHSAYLASKAALLSLTLILAHELAPSIRVNGVSPGAITFPAHYNEGRKRQVARRSLLKRSGTPEDVADAVAYLAGARFVTGQVLKVDGGRFA